MTKSLDPSEIYKEAYSQNVRVNQIGGETDGISPDVAADIGYETPEQLAEILSNLGNVATDSEVIVESTKSAGPIFELPGKDGRVNPRDRLPSRPELLRMIGDERSTQQEINMRGAKTAKSALGRTLRRVRQA